MADITSVDLARLAGQDLESASPDLLRAMVKTFAEALMGVEAGAACRAPYGQVSEDRANYRNGYRDRRQAPGQAASSWRSRGCRRAATSPSGCWSGGGAPSRRWSA